VQHDLRDKRKQIEEPEITPVRGRDFYLDFSFQSTIIAAPTGCGTLSKKEQRGF
jgi:hypothetical protein